MAFFKTSDGLQLYYEDIGQGTPVLCLAGLTRCTTDFSFVAPHLADYRMIAMDYRGRGRSDYDESYINYAIPREAQDAIELLDHLGIDKTAILGTSRGGLIAMTLAATAPDRLWAVILNDIGPEIAAPGLERIWDYVGIEPTAKTLEEAAHALQHLSQAQFPDVPFERWLRHTKHLFRQSDDGLRLRYDARLRDAMIEQGKSGLAPDLWPIFDALKSIPTGVIRGANSDLLSAETYARMITRRPEIIAAEVPDRGHVPFLDEPEAVRVIHQVLDLA
ncbi:MAG: alpha/beta hydrolase [Pseudomonadota bacterium]